MVIQTCNYKQSTNSEVHTTNDEILIPVSANLPIVLSPKTPTKTQMPSTDMTYIHHQIDRLRQEMKKNAAESNEFKNLIKKNVAKERIRKRDEA